MSEPAAALIDALVRRFAEARPLRAGSFIITIFGDAVAPRGGEIALASLLEIVRPFGISETLLRTAVSRLVQEGWLAGRRVGRHSFYRLTESGAERFAAATRRIYRAQPPAWAGELTLVVIPAALAERREAVRRELRWAGFGTLGPGTLVHPAPDREAMARALAASGAAEAVLVVPSPARQQGDLPRALAEEGWRLDELGRRYRDFVTVFAPLDAAAATDAGDPARALSLRLLLIHEFRKAVLRDPVLPAAFLPADWPGFAAHRLAARLYRAMVDGAEAQLSRIGANAAGPLPPPDPAFAARFAAG